jgi:hypothetical protein
VTLPNGLWAPARPSEGTGLSVPPPPKPPPRLSPRPGRGPRDGFARWPGGAHTSVHHRRTKPGTRSGGTKCFLGDFDGSGREGGGSPPTSATVATASERVAATTGLLTTGAAAGDDSLLGAMGGTTAATAATP